MITLYIGDSLNPKEILVSPEAKISEIFRSNGINYDNGTVTADARKLGTAELDKTVNELGITDGTYLTVSQKLQSAK